MCSILCKSTKEQVEKNMEENNEVFEKLEYMRLREKLRKKKWIDSNAKDKYIEIQTFHET